jgi:hypothetical protein
LGTADFGKSVCDGRGPEHFGTTVFKRFDLTSHLYENELEEQLSVWAVPATIGVACGNPEGQELYIAFSVVLTPVLANYGTPNQFTFLELEPAKGDMFWPLVPAEAATRVREVASKSPLDKNVDETLRLWIPAIRNARKGLPSATNFHNFRRMLYFSATTVTTVGFGDITPISDRARAWTAAEAVSGIVVIGLFLNSLATRIAGRQR